MRDEGKAPSVMWYKLQLEGVFRDQQNWVGKARNHLWGITREMVFVHYLYSGRTPQLAPLCLVLQFLLLLGLLSSPISISGAILVPTHEGVQFITKSMSACISCDI